MLNSATYPIFGASDISFHMDGAPVSTYQNSPTENLDTYTYNVPVFAMPSLKYGTHSLMIQNGVANGTDALILLDYIVYTYANPKARLASMLNPHLHYRADDGLEATTPGPSNVASTNLPTPPPSSPSPSASSSSSKRSDSQKILAIKTAVPIGIVLLLGVASFSFWRRHRLRQLEVHRQTLRVHPSYLFPAEHGHAQKHSSRGWSEGSTSVGIRSHREELSTSTTTRIVEILPPAYCATV